MSFKRPWSVKMVDSVMQRQPVLAKRWGYEYGLVLKGIEQVWKKTKEVKYFDYIKDNVDSFVKDTGEIETYQVEEYNLDQINAGKILFFLYQETKDQKYKTAADLLRQQINTHPRTPEGGLWHKQIYPYQMWLDGIYMGSPFYAEYTKLFGDAKDFDDIVNQVILIAKHTTDPKTGLLYHGWDESKQQKWSNPQTGCSPHFWGRAMGWYVMAIVDVLDYLPENHMKRADILQIFKNAVDALIRFQDPQRGVWYQVLDQGNRKWNYLESSASCMIVYAIAKAVRNGYLDSGYLASAQKGYAGILEEFIYEDQAGLTNLLRVCGVAGLGQTGSTAPFRDGSYEYYISEPIVTNDFKGIGPFILASLEME